MVTPTEPGQRSLDLAALARSWVAAGIISEQQAQQILAFGDGAVPVGAVPGSTPQQVVRRSSSGAQEPTNRLPLAVEVIAYLGAALIVAAIIAILSRSWQDVPQVGRLVLIAVPTAVGFGAGWFLRSQAGPLSRLASVLWLLALGGVAGVTVVALDRTDVSNETTATVVLSLVASAALIAWWFQRQALQLLALIGTSTGLIAAVMQQSGVERTSWFGVVLIGLGLVWFLQSRVPMLQPALAGTVAGLVVAYIGTQMIASDREVLGLGLAVGGAVALMAVSIFDDSTVELLLGAFALFTTLPSLLQVWFGGSVGAPIALLICGLVLVGVALRIARRRTRPGPGGSGH
ncbi:MAG: DUF2157 domain-containing protein, partial [Actinomycetes bacterium]